jgi:hypothetical protein
MRMRETFQQIYQAPDMQTFKTLLQKWFTNAWELITPLQTITVAILI